jgi:dienelactone hydrolase
MAMRSSSRLALLLCPLALSLGCGGGASSGGTGTTALADPALPGPYTVQEADGLIATVTGGHTNVAVHCAAPSAGPSAGPYPVVVFGAGLQIPASQYAGYLRRLASFGYVALTVDFQASVVDLDNQKEAADLLAGLDWAAGQSTLHADAQNAGMTGHSLGGKVALLAATQDARVKAAIVLDPVDGGGLTCNPPSCVMVAPLMASLHIPTGFIGEVTDASGAFQACAPAASNFTTFYAGATSPSLSVTVTGANHMSFLDDVVACGLTCSFCNAATAPAAQTHDLALAYVTAFYERHLRGKTGYDAYLTGAKAQERYVVTNQASIASK